MTSSHKISSQRAHILHLFYSNVILYTVLVIFSGVPTLANTRT